MENNKKENFFDGSFSIPESSYSKYPNEKVSVVAIAGSSADDANCDKTNPIRILLGQNIAHFSLGKVPSLDESLVKIDGYYDSKHKTVYLHLIGTADIGLWIHKEATLTKLINERGMVSAKSKLEEQYLRALLLLFSVSHLVLWCNSSHIFDISLLNTLQTLNKTRTDFLDQIKHSLSSVPGISRKWLSIGRLCCPRILFLFNKRSTNDEFDKEFTAVRELEQALEDQIYRLFRRNWIITNNSSNSMVALPSNQQFVYIFEKHQQQIACSEDALFEMLQDVCSGASSEDNLEKQLSTVSLYSSDNIGKSASHGSEGLLDVLSNHLLSQHKTDLNRNVSHQFSTFLKQHLSLVFTGGFDDDRKTTSVPVFVVPSLSSWFAAVKKLYPIIMFPENSKEISSETLDILNFESPHMTMMKSQLQSVCSDAIKYYREKTSSRHYSFKVHNDLMAESIGFFRNSSYGDQLSSLYEEELVKKLQSMWSDGKKGCEQTSLFGNYCVEMLDDHKTEEDERSGKPVHKFGVSFRKFCNCGTLLDSMDDSMLLKGVNYDYYKNLEDICCHGLEAFEFPALNNGGKFIHIDPEFNSEKEIQWRSDESVSNSPSKGSVFYSSSGKEVSDMLCSDSPQNFLPKYSSWSLVSLGPASLYSHSIGITTQPGFIRGSNFLLPWKLKVEIKTGKEWQSVMNSVSRKGGKYRMEFDRNDFFIKVFLGMEYECPDGHKFLMSSPTDVMKKRTLAALATGNVIATDSMPLYWKCECRSDSVVYGQLMRIHIVTPKAPVNVIIKPKVRPGPPPCPSFYPLLSKEGIKLPQNSYWVLRLPNIYAHNGIVHAPPCRSEEDDEKPSDNKEALLLAGMFSISNVDTSYKPY